MAAVPLWRVAVLLVAARCSGTTIDELAARLEALEAAMAAMASTVNGNTATLERFEIEDRTEDQHIAQLEQVVANASEAIRLGEGFREGDGTGHMTIGDYMADLGQELDVVENELKGLSEEDSGLEALVVLAVALGLLGVMLGLAYVSERVRKRLKKQAHMAFRESSMPTRTSTMFREMELPTPDGTVCSYSCNSSAV